MSRNKSVFHESLTDVSAIGMNKFRLYDEISMLTMGRFKWTNLPQGVESRIIEKYLFENGEIAFFFDNALGYLTLPCSSSGELNVYGEPLKYMVQSESTYFKELGIDDFVKIKGNFHSTPTRLKVLYYTQYINEIETTMKVNLKQQRLPYIVPTNEKTLLTFKNIINEVEKGETAIFVDESLGNRGDLGIQVLKTEAPYLLDKLQMHKNDLLNEMYSWLGINNANNDKKERLIVDEVNVNNSFIQLTIENEYEMRKIACDEINKKYGLKIKVEKTSDTLDVSFKGDEQQNKKKGWLV